MIIKERKKERKKATNMNFKVFVRTYKARKLSATFIDETNVVMFYFYNL